MVIIKDTTEDYCMIEIVWELLSKKTINIFLFFLFILSVISQGFYDLYTKSPELIEKLGDLKIILLSVNATIPSTLLNLLTSIVIVALMFKKHVKEINEALLSLLLIINFILTLALSVISRYINENNIEILMNQNLSFIVLISITAVASFIMAVYRIKTVHIIKAKYKGPRHENT